MKKTIKSMLVIGIIATAAQILPMNIAKANEKDTKAGSVSISYNFNVPVLGDSETTLVNASTDVNAANDVSYIEKGKLTSWVENSSGTNCSDKITYATAGYHRMAYKSNRPQTVRLNISTSSSTWGKVGTTGYFRS